MNEQAEVHLNPEECKDAFLKQFEKGSQEGPWMGVVCSIKDGVLTVQRTTSNFPTGEFDRALLLLKKQLDQERKALILDDSPLPLAPHLAARLQTQELPVRPTLPFPAQLENHDAPQE